MRIVAAIIGLLLLGGCESIWRPVTAIDGATIIFTDKSLGDHLISAGSGKDCSTVRTEQGMTYCKEDEISLTPAVYCYRTLGDVDCFAKPDPYGLNQRKIGESDHNYVRSAPAPR